MLSLFSVFGPLFLFPPFPWSHFKDIQDKKTLDWVSSNSTLSNKPSNSLDSYPKSNSKSINFCSNYEKHCNSPLQYLTNSYSQKLVFQCYLIINNISSNWWKFQQRRKNLLISISKPTMLNIHLAKKPMIENMVWCFFDHSKGHLTYFACCWYLWNSAILD